MTTLIVACDKKNGISKDGIIPWKFKLDSDYFHDITTRVYEQGKCNVLVAGRNTWKQMSKMKLGNREFLVVSNTMKNSNELHVASSIDDAINLTELLEYAHVFVCGGKNVYKEYLERKLVNTILITSIDFDYECDNVLDFDIVPKSFYHEEHKRFVIDGVKLSFDSYTIQHYHLIRNPEISYLNMLYDILQNDYKHETRNSFVYSNFAMTLTYDLGQSFPLLTTKRVFFKGIFEELLFFLRGDTDTKILEKKGINIWKGNTNREFLDKSGHKDYKEGDMGPMYGFNWLHYGAKYKGCDAKHEGFNQLKYCLDLLKNDPHSRRIIMTTFNPEQASEGVLYPCHGIVVQFYVGKDNVISCSMTQRSADACCGIPFNIASYALLVHFICNVLNTTSEKKQEYTPGKLTLLFNDVHIYNDHVNNAMRQMLRIPYKFPQLKINKKMTDMTDIEYEDIELLKYRNYGPLDYKMVA